MSTMHMHKLQSDRDLLIHAVKSFKESFLQSEHHSLLKYHIAAVHRHYSFAIHARIPNVFKGAGSRRLFVLVTLISKSCNSYFLLILICFITIILFHKFAPPSPDPPIGADLDVSSILYPKSVSTRFMVM